MYLDYIQAMYGYAFRQDICQHPSHPPEGWIPKHWVTFSCGECGKKFSYMGTEDVKRMRELEKDEAHRWKHIDFKYKQENPNAIN